MVEHHHHLRRVETTLSPPIWRSRSAARAAPTIVQHDIVGHHIDDLPNLDNSLRSGVAGNDLRKSACIGRPS